MPSDVSGQLPRIIPSVARLCLAEGQCDACPPSVSMASAGLTLPTTDTYSVPPTLNTVRLDNHHWVAYAPVVSVGPAVLNNAALALLRRFRRPRSPDAIVSAQSAMGREESVADAVSQMQRERLLVPHPCPAPSLVESPRTLIGWLHVTRACNLRCAYCYLDAAPEDMSPETGELAIHAIFRSAVKHGFSGIKLKYAGGEPTLAFPLVLRLHRRAARLAEEHALELDGVVISNGVNVTQDILDTMQAVGLRLAVSLDGLGAYHDCQRRLADGEGSSQATLQSIDRALSVGLTPDISVTVTARSLSGLPELIEWLLAHDLPFGLDFYRENNTSASRQDLRLDEQRLIVTMQTVFQVIESNLPRRSLLASLVDRTNLAWPHTRACSVGTSYMVIDTRGRIAKCQMDIDHTVTDVTADDPLTDVQASKTGIQNLPVDEKESCRECEWRYWCAGGCPLEAHRATGRWNTRSPYCSMYRALFPEVLRLEGLRMLKVEENVS